MRPILFTIGRIEISSWWAMLLGGFFIAGLFAYLDKDRPAPRQVLIIFLCLLAGGVIGARLFYVVWHINYYLDRPLEAILFYKGGLISFGGSFFALLFGYLYVKASGLSFFKTADLVCAYVPIIDAMRRLGCFLQGCCFGRPTNLPFGVAPPGGLVSYHPAQLYFVLSSVIIFFALRFIRHRQSREGTIFFSYFLLYFAFRFFIEFTRPEHVFRKGFITVPQTISLAGFLIFLAVFKLKDKNARI